MGNTGRPSTGCSRCRKRRIKCDERRPGCVRCEKLGEECPGYTHGYWIFRDESDTARKRALKKQSRPKESPASSGSPATSATTPSQNGQSLSPNTSVDSLVVFQDDHPKSQAQSQPLSKSQPSILTDIEFRSVCLFMETFTLDASTEGPYPAHLDFLPGMYMSPKSDPSIRKAVTAISLTNFANRYGAKDLASTAWQAYGEALAATNHALQNPAVATSDAVLAAVYLLGLNELICRPDMPLLGGAGWHHHVFGTLQLLRLRWTKKLKTTTELQLFQMVHSTVLIKHMMAYEPPPADSMAFILAQDYPEGLGAKIASAFFCKVVDVRSRMYAKGMAVGSKSDEDSTELEALADEACILLRSRSFENWTDNEPAWQVKTSTDENASRLDKHSFGSQTISLYWIFHWTAKVCLQKSVIDAFLVLLTCRDDPEEVSALQEKVSTMKDELQATSEKIIGSVEYCLTGFYAKKRDPNSFFSRSRVAAVSSSVGALPMFWALGTVKHVPYSDVMQKNLATAALRRVGTENSIAQALLHTY